MTTTPRAAFDHVAARYAQLWSDTPAGTLQRDAVWRAIDSLFPPASQVLDLGCGTGDDALHLAQRGVNVTGIDESTTMIEIARGRGVDARCLPIERLAGLDGPFNGVLSNFGALNCVERLDALTAPLARLVVPGGALALCLLGKCCVWEALWFGVRGQWRKSFRRARAGAWSESLRIPVYYPSTQAIAAALAPTFRLKYWTGIGVAVPPSYVKLSGSTIARLGALDGAVAHWPLVRALGDHRLYVFERL